MDLIDLEMMTKAQQMADEISERLSDHPELIGIASLLLAMEEQLDRAPSEDVRRKTLVWLGKWVALLPKAKEIRGDEGGPVLIRLQ